jgi:hypothetical protein
MQEVTTAAAPWNSVCPPPHPEMDITTAGAGLTSPSASTASDSSVISLSPRPHLEAPPGAAGSHTSKDGHGVQTDMSSSASSRINDKGGVQAPGTPTLHQVLVSPLLEKGDGWIDADKGRRLLEERNPLLTVKGATLANNEQNLKSTLHGDIYTVDILWH